VAGVLLGKPRLNSVYGLMTSPFTDHATFLAMLIRPATALGLQRRRMNKMLRLEFNASAGDPEAGLAERV
jgi:hypothetical protein